MLPMIIDPSYVRQFVQMLEGEPAAEMQMGGYENPVQMVGSTAVISVTGPIDYRPSIWSNLGLMSSSQAIRGVFNSLVEDPGVKRIVFDIDSPGGLYSGLPELANDVFEARGSKQLIAVANPLAASGALWLGAAAERFLVLGSGQAGSLGAIMVHTDMSRFLDEAGVTTTILRDPPGKADFNPYEPLSDESREHHQQIVADIAGEFRAAVAKYRGVSRGVAASDFGRGRILSAKDAVSARLVDGTVDSIQTVIGSRMVRRKSATNLHARLQLKRSALTAGDN